MSLNNPTPDADDLIPIPNQVPWYYISLALLLGGALLSHGVTTIGRSWERELGLPGWFSVAAQAFSIVFASALGCLAGYLVWEWALGGMVALVGALSSQLVLSLVRARLGVVGDAVTNGVRNEPGEPDEKK